MPQTYAPVDLVAKLMCGNLFMRKLFSKECELTISWHVIHFDINDFLKKIAFNRTKVAIRAIKLMR